MESSETPYKIVFFDGDEEHEKGHVGLNSFITFKRFQAIISQKLGFSQGRLCNIAFVCNNSGNNNLRRFPINENTNFDIILKQYNPRREQECYFLVSMKKSRRQRKGRHKIGGPGFETVRRQSNTGGLGLPLGSGFEDGRRFRRGSVIKKSQSCCGNNTEEYYLQNFGQPPRQQPGQRSACQLCRMAKEWPAPFHLCVQDAVVRGTRGPSPAGPIQRPAKRQLGYIYSPFIF